MAAIHAADFTANFEPNGHSFESAQWISYFRAYYAAVVSTIKKTLISAFISAVKASNNANDILSVNKTYKKTINATIR